MAENRDLQKEIEQIQLEIEDMTANEARELLQQYKRSSKKITSIAAGLLAGYIDDDGNLNMSNAQIAVEMRDFEKEIEEEINKIGGLEVAIVSGILGKAYSQSYYKTAFQLDRGLIDDAGIAIGVNFNILRPEFLESVINRKWEGSDFSSRIWKSKENLITTLKSEMYDSMRRGTDSKVIAKRLQRRFDVSWNEAFRLIRTETARVRSEGQEKIYQENDAVQQVIWISTIDGVTDPEDAELDGTIWNKFENHPIPPNHVNCRCTIAPVAKNWSPSTRRDNETGETIEYKTYSEWAKERGIN